MPSSCIFSWNFKYMITGREFKLERKYSLMCAYYNFDGNHYEIIYIIKNNNI